MKKLRKGRLDLTEETEEIDPMSGIVNLADAMLVFACGLMVALVLNWNVDISKNKKEVDLSESKDVTNSDIFEDENIIDSESESSLEEMGKVYKDPVSGKMYMIFEK